jgi:hypothetical protein
MSRRWAYNEQLMIGLKIERILKMIHKDADIIIKDDNDRIFTTVNVVQYLVQEY